MIDNIENYKLDIRYDGSLPVATGTSRKDTHWKNKTLLWSALVKKLQTPVVTPETHAEFMKKPKAEQDSIKDIGGFVGGALSQGRRKASNVGNRQILTLDADFAPADILTSIDLILGESAYAVYCTHKHTPEKPRLRILIPIDRKASPDEYEAAARKIAEKIGIDYFDDTTYQANRMMFWPSVPCDIEYLFDFNDAPWLSIDSVLDEYPDWTDVSYWPESSRTKDSRRKAAEKQEDPTKKRGLIGAFCRAYDIHDAIETFLTEVYMPCNSPDRYTYTGGSTSAGLVLYDDRFAYSNHATDPASGKLCNAFDLVRLHLFGAMDDESPEGTSAGKLPSFKAMEEMCRNDAKTKRTLIEERKEEANRMFEEDEEAPEDSEKPENTEKKKTGWEEHLEINKAGEIRNTLNNVCLIIQKDPMLKGIVFNQMADNLEIVSAVPWEKREKFWRDADDAQLESYLARTYAEFSKGRIQTATDKIGDDRAYHPVRKYLDSLPEWDGVKRVDSLMIDYLGADDSPYIRAVTRKMLCAAVRRVRIPGIKFDYILVMNGPQGIGKSTLINKLGGEWYSDSLNLSDMNDKTAAEKLQGYWIIEIGELAGMKKADTDKVKAFISRQDDKYRASFGRRVSPHPRQCVFFGTTNNEDGYLRDVTGNRRYWNVSVPGDGIYRPWELNQDDVNQIWAEAKVYESQNEKLYLSPELEEEARKEQLKAVEHDDREGLVREYLETRLPSNWYQLTVYQRKDYFLNREDEDLEQKAEMERKEVSYLEIWTECFGEKKEAMKPSDSYFIKMIMMRIPEWKKQKNPVRIPGYGQQRIYRKSVTTSKKL